MAELPTVKVSNPDAPGGYVVINESDFDAKAHTVYQEKQTAPAPTPAPKQAKA